MESIASNTRNCNGENSNDIQGLKERLNQEYASPITVNGDAFAQARQAEKAKHAANGNAKTKDAAMQSNESTGVTDNGNRQSEAPDGAPNLDASWEAADTSAQPPVPRAKLYGVEQLSVDQNAWVIVVVASDASYATKAVKEARAHKIFPSRITVGLVASAESTELETLWGHNKIIWPESPGLEGLVDDIAKHLINSDTQVLTVDPPEGLRLSQAGMLGAPWFKKRAKGLLLKARPWQPAGETLAEDANATEEMPGESSSNPEEEPFQDVADKDVAAGSMLPHGFLYADDGSIKYRVKKEEGDDLVHVCSPIEFLAATDNVEETKPGVYVKIRADSGHCHKLAFPRSALVHGDDLFCDLIDHGLRFVPNTPNKNLLRRLFMEVRPFRRARCVPNLGWHGAAFVLPDEVIGQLEGEEIVFQPPHPVQHHYRVAGTFDGWKQSIAARAVGNSRLEFAISNAFAGPLLDFANMDGGGYHYRGPSTSGKSTSLHAAGSVWGGGGRNGFADSWRTTDNALEGLCLLHTDSFLALDEMSQVDGKTASNSAYMIANGSGKSRSSTTGTLLPRYQWRVSFLSTGELTLASKVSEDGLHSTAGQEVRVIDIPADAGHGMGLFENLHGLSRPSDFADAIRDAAKLHYGHAARAFLTELVKDVPGIASRVRKGIEKVVNQICPKKADGQVRRVAQRFALTACAGELATAFGVLPWRRGRAYCAAKRCFNDWLQSRGSAGKKEEIDSIEAVLGFLQRYRSRFRHWDDPDAVIYDCAGYVHVGPEGRTFYVFTDVFRKDICGKHGIDPEAAADTLAERQYLQKSSDNKRTRSERLPKEGKQRVYVIKMQEEES